LKQTNDYFDGKYFPQYSIVFEGNHFTKIPPYGNVPEQLVIISPGSTSPVGNVALPLIITKLIHVKFPLTSVTINVLFSCLKIIGEGSLLCGLENQFVCTYPNNKLIKMMNIIILMIFIPFLIFNLNIITINIIINQVINNHTNISIKALKKITEIIKPIIIKTVPIVDVSNNLFSILLASREQCFIINIFGGYQKLKNKQTHNHLFIRIGVLYTNFLFLFLCYISKLSFRIIKFVGTVLASIFWYLSSSNRNMNAITFWTDFNKISSYLKKYVIGWFNKSTFLSSQNLISDMTMVATPYKVTSMGGYL